MKIFTKLIYKLLPVFSVFYLVFSLSACSESGDANDKIVTAAPVVVPVEVPVPAEIPINPENPMIQIDTNKGKIIIELFADMAPITVKNFLRYVNEGVHNNTIFHRVVKDSLIQAGEYTFDEKPITTVFPPIKNEADSGLKNNRGTIAMARSANPDSATRQYFINTANNKKFDYTEKTSVGWGFCVFGKVRDGMEVINRISRVKTRAYGPFDRYAPTAPIAIRSITVINQ